MEQFMTLYFKELRNMKHVLLIMLGVIIGYLLYANFFKKYIYSMFLLQHFLYLFPILFVYSIYRGEKNQTIYQSELYKNQKHKFLLIKYLIFIDALIMMTVIMFINILLIKYDILPKLRPKGVVATAVGDLGLAISALIGYFSGPFILLSFICTAWGVMQFIKRNQFIRLILGLLIVIAGFISYKSIIGLDIVPNIYKYFFLTLVIGAVYAFIGIFIYERSG